jgi:hypothetical protein
VRRSTTVTVCRPPLRAGSGGPSSATRSSSPPIFLVHKPKHGQLTSRGDGGRRSACAPSWASPPTCSPRRSRRRYFPTSPRPPVVRFPLKTPNFDFVFRCTGSRISVRTRPVFVGNRHGCQIMLSEPLPSLALVGSQTK